MEKDAICTMAVITIKGMMFISRYQISQTLKAMPPVTFSEYKLVFVKVTSMQLVLDRLENFVLQLLLTHIGSPAANSR